MDLVPRRTSGARVVGGDPSHPGTLLLALRDVKTIFISLRALGDATANCSGWQPGRVQSESLPCLR
jgi:hypothetical protein